MTIGAVIESRDMIGTPVKVAICVITYQRPDGLRRLLEAVKLLRYARVEPPEAMVVVVDNDPAGGGAEVCKALEGDLPIPLVYQIEPRRGIPFARNTAVQLVQHAVDFIAFIDDDEVPEPQWLDELLAVQKELAAPVIAGPVLPRFGKPAPAWLIAGGFFDRPRPATGTLVEYPGSGNILIRSDVLRLVEGGFDERLALAGGTDTLYFRRVRQAGLPIVFAHDAVVHETVPASRVRVRWLLQRTYRVGNTLSTCDLILNPTPATRVARGMKGIARIMMGLVGTSVALVLVGKGYRIRLLRSLRNIWRGAGMLAGLAGLRYEEYRRIHST